MHFLIVGYFAYKKVYGLFLTSSILTLLSVYCEYKQWRLFTLENYRKLTTVKCQLESVIDDSTSFVYSRFSELRNESLHLFRVKRDVNLVELPDILLVRGDEVNVSTIEEWQALAQIIEPHSQQDISLPTFVTLSTSKFVPFLEGCISSKDSKTNWIHSKLRLMRQCMLYLFFLHFLLLR